MLKIRARCPCCGTRLNEEALYRDVDFTDGKDVMEQDIGGRGNITSGAEDTFENYPDIAQYFLDNINEAKEYLEEILGIEDNEESEVDKIANQILEEDDYVDED